MSNAWASRGQRGGGGGGRGGAPPRGRGGGAGGNNGTGRSAASNNGGGMASVTSGMASMQVSQGSRGSSDRGASSNEQARGSGEGRRGRGRRGQVFDLVLSRRTVCDPERQSKRGTGGDPINLVANFFPMRSKPEWNLYNYRVDFKNAADGGMDERRTRVKKRLLAQQRNVLPMHIFDGSNLYTINRLSPNPLILVSQREGDNAAFELTITFVGTLQCTDIAYLQFFNIIMRRCLQILNFIQIGRHYYDAAAQIDLADIGYKLIPGFITNIRQYEDSLMMCVEITHKVLREASCWQLMRQCRNNEDVSRMMLDTVIMTTYNNKTYRVDDIAFDKNPATTFEYNGSNISLANYYYTRYQLTVREMNQPLFVSRPRQRDIHRGDTQEILLLPEFCYPTGIAEHDRANYSKMNVLSKYLQQDPNDRSRSTLAFMNRLRSSNDTQNELQQWGLRFEAMDLVSVQGRVLPTESLYFKEMRPQQGQQPRITQVKVLPTADWTNELRTDSKHGMAAAAELKTANWVLIYPPNVDPTDLVRTMITVGRGMGFLVEQPADTYALTDPRIPTYLDAMEKLKNTHKGLQFIFTIMPMARDTTAVYNEVKKRCLTRYGLLNQCFQAKHLNPNSRGRLMSVVTKLLVQINAKRGGEPWRTNLTTNIPTMIVGFDVYHPGKGRNEGKKSYGAVVSSTNKFISRFFSTTSPHGTMEEISTMLETDIIKCVKAFSNGTLLPANIVLYRDGVGEGQLQYVYDTEVKQIKEALKKYYESVGKPEPKLMFIVVTKKGNARIMTRVNRGYDNPPPGTIVDNTITLPERYDFFLVAQQARKGQTVSPTTYNVLHDDIKITPALLQQLTYQQCYMYFNWSGTVAVPAVCQYAHKLAYLTGTALDTRAGAGAAAPVLPNLLQYLYYL